MNVPTNIDFSLQFPTMGVVILRLGEAFDKENVERVRIEINELINRGLRTFIFDFSEVVTCDGIALATLCIVNRYNQDNGVKFIIASPGDDAKILINQMQQVHMPVFSSTKAALASIDRDLVEPSFRFGS